MKERTDVPTKAPGVDPTVKREQDIALFNVHEHAITLQTYDLEFFEQRKDEELELVISEPPGSPIQSYI